MLSIFQEYNQATELGGVDLVFAHSKKFFWCERSMYYMFYNVDWNPKPFNVIYAKGDKRVLKLLSIWADDQVKNCKVAEKLFKEATHNGDEESMLKKIESAKKSCKTQQLTNQFDSIKDNLKEEDLDPRVVKSIMDKHYKAYNADWYNRLYDDCMPNIKSRAVQKSLKEYDTLINEGITGSILNMQKKIIFKGEYK